MPVGGVNVRVIGVAGVVLVARVACVGPRIIVVEGRDA